MGRQINFYLHPEDLQEFEVILRAKGDFKIITYFQYSDHVTTVDKTFDTDQLKPGERVYLMREQDDFDATMVHYEKFGYWLFDSNNIPVLHYDRCAFINNIIHRGRLYFQPRFVRDLQWVDKSPEFVKWADDKIKVARKFLKKYKFDFDDHSFSEYVGPNTRQWLDSAHVAGKQDTDLISKHAVG